jgi:antitoxin HicB
VRQLNFHTYFAILQAYMSPKETFITHEYRYTVHFEPAPEGGYVVTCPALPGLVTQGDTLDEARIMAAEAIAGYIEVLRKHNHPIPAEDSQPRTSILRETVSVSV